LPEEVRTGETLTSKRVGNDGFMSEKDFREAKRKFESGVSDQTAGGAPVERSRTAATIGLHRQSLQEKLRELNVRRPGRELVEEEE